MNGTEIKIELFADDLTVFLGNDESYSAFFDVVSKFGDCTGLTINLEKTEILWPTLADTIVEPATYKRTSRISQAKMATDLTEKCMGS